MSDEKEKEKKQPSEEEQKKGAGPAGSGTTETQKHTEVEEKKEKEEKEQLEEEKPYEFRHPTLRGRSPEEIERLYGLQESATNELGAKLTSIESRLEQMAERGERPPKEETKKRSADEFFADPEGATEQLLERSVGKLREELKREIHSVAREFRPDPRDGLRQKFDDWSEVEPYIDHLLRQQKFPNPDDPKLLESLYYTAVGIRTKMGDRNMDDRRERGGEEEVGEERGYKGSIPQHRASSPPKPTKKDDGGKKRRQLTESERRIAREQKLNDEEYLDLQNPNYDDEKSGITFLADSEERP